MDLLKLILLILVTMFFALNMGGSGIAPSFAANWGGKLIKKSQALLLFGFFVILGAVSLGRGVSITLGKNLIPSRIMSFDVVLIILIAATLSLFLANIMKIPQSTSQVTVGAIIGVGLYFRHLNISTLLFKIIPMWVILPFLSFVVTLLLYKLIYPPTHSNLHIYQRLFANHDKLKLSSLISGCYVAFAIGSNNVANAAGPLNGAGLLNIGLGLALIAPLFGLGAWLFGKGPLETVGKEIIPLGLVSSTLVSFVTATLLIFASILGIPQSLVQLNLCSILAISCLKDGHKHTLDKHLTRKTFIVWAVTPLLSIGISFLLLALFIKR